MDTAVAHAVRFRHVVFPDSVGGYGRAVNLAPTPFAGGPARAEPFTPPEPRAAHLSAPALSEDEMSFLRGLFARVGLGLRHYKPETLHRRLPACLRALRASSVAHARSVLQRNPQLAWSAVGAVVIGVTSFFRDAPVFDALRRDVLPRLAHDCRAAGRPLRVWSAGCSDGAELYSVAMLLDECGALARGDCELLGTDCRPAAIARAAGAAYDPAAVRGVPPALLSRYFDFDGSQYRVAPAIQDAVRWRVADALDPSACPAGPFDLVLCRNLIIYLQPDAAAALWATLQSALRPGGVLLLGKAERPVGVRGLKPVGAESPPAADPSPAADSSPVPCLYFRDGAA
jgi:chemotaxis methyl-accepting protein methylase